MGLLNQIFGTDDSDKSHPPRPDDEERSREYTFTVYRVTVSYRNGETETFQSYGRYTTGDDVVTYNVQPEPRRKLTSDDGDAGYTFDRRSLNYKVLDREPVEEKIGTETWRLDWTVTYEADTWFDGDFKQWDATASDPQLERIEQTIDGDGS